MLRGLTRELMRTFPLGERCCGRFFAIRPPVILIDHARYVIRIISGRSELFPPRLSISETHQSRRASAVGGLQECPVKIASYNINNVNKRLPVLVRWLKESTPDVACKSSSANSRAFRRSN